MKIYHYKEDNQEYIGESVADPDPLDVGNWLIPAHATTVESPEEVEGKTRNFINGEWVYVDIPVEPEPVVEEVVTPII